jgi:hypothetical protein
MLYQSFPLAPAGGRIAVASRLLAQLEQSTGRAVVDDLAVWLLKVKFRGPVLSRRDFLKGSTQAASLLPPQAIGVARAGNVYPGLSSENGKSRRDRREFLGETLVGDWPSLPLR